MPMNATQAQRGTTAKPAAAALPQEGGRNSALASGSKDAAPKLSGYGLPCSRCKLYYPADLDCCPTCHNPERVLPVAPKVPRVTRAAPDPVPNTTAVEREREEFLRQFKSQLMEAHAEAASTPGADCMVGEHTGEAARAEICKACYERLLERLDVCEAALHLDLKEAAQIIYDAVWADPSDPNKTYENAANALLTALRKRAGVNSLLGPFHPLER
jgi:hypothetical protein